MVLLQALINLLVAVSIIALQFSRLSYFGLSFSTTIFVIRQQLEKGLLPIFVTDPGIVTDVRPEHPWKASKPIVVTELGIVTEDKSMQPSKA